MSVIEIIKDNILGDGFGPCNWNFVLYESDYCNFEVLDNDIWCKIDVHHPYRELYKDEDVPDDVIVRLNKIIDSDKSWNDWQVPEDEYVRHYEDLLRAEFDDVRFLGTDYIPGAVY